MTREEAIAQLELRYGQDPDWGRLAYVLKSPQFDAVLTSLNDEDLELVCEWIEQMRKARLQTPIRPKLPTQSAERFRLGGS
jgi:hypothetical protein